MVRLHCGAEFSALGAVQCTASTLLRSLTVMAALTSARVDRFRKHRETIGKLIRFITSESYELDATESEKKSTNVTGFLHLWSLYINMLDTMFTFV